jgi:hypothetical protein
VKSKYITSSLSISVLIVVLSLCGCDEQRLNQYSTFATAGQVYVANFHQVTAQAGSAMIAVDSVLMSTAHKDVVSDLKRNPAKYSAQVVQHDELLQKYLATLQLIDAHATALGAYFDAISKLTDNKTATNTASAATDLLDAVDTLNTHLAKATILGKPVQDYVSKGAPFVVAHFQVKALDAQLQRAAPIVDLALSLQEGAVTAIGEQIKVSLTDTLKNRESIDVIEPFLKTDELPASWNTNREAYLRANVTLSNVSSAQAAIKQLHITFKQLVENPTASIDLQSLISDISAMSAYANAAQTTLKTTGAK